MPDQFPCRRCGRCCRGPGYVKVAEDEIDGMAAFLGLEPGVFIEQYLCLRDDRRGLKLRDQASGDCIFYREPPACVIQPVKPRQCRDFPLKWNFPEWEKSCPAAVKNQVRPIESGSF